MDHTSEIYAQIDQELKERAEEILAKLGITPAGAIQMLYRQIVLHGGMPFDDRLPIERPIAMGGMSREELNEALAKGIESLQTGRVLTADEFDAELNQEYPMN